MSGLSKHAAVRPAWHARRYAQRAEQGGGRGGRGHHAGQEGGTPAVQREDRHAARRGLLRCVECQRTRPSPLTAEAAKCTTFPTSSDHKLKGGMPHFLPPNRKAESQVCRHPAAREQKVARPTPWSLFWLSAFRCLRARLVKMQASEVRMGRRLIHDGAFYTNSSPRLKSKRNKPVRVADVFVL